MPLSPSATRALLEQLGHRPNRQLGQNFLVDGNIVRKSLELAAVQPGDRVVEIGPGLGTLTGELLAAGAEVWAVEFDPRLHAHLAATVVPGAGGRLRLLHGDAVAHPLAGYDTARGDFKIVANLPYAISTPWFDGVLAGPLPERTVLMVQREAADRFLAEPGTKSFGAISIFLQSAFVAAPGHAVSRNCFFPAPDIDSYLLNLQRRPEPHRFRETTRQLVRACFQQRRKQIGALLRRHDPAALAAWEPKLAAAGLDLRARPEQISTPLWQELDRLLAA
ncbi:MAG TPA: 16S rRNA (adenine(1518)-N(6)/adenine(1519)-N(6))-dimethyltransferase RsmA [Opitutaceae bacterium]|nr:16S rRNA (adenine(1518)-N(6)/adenine(1519)-N(6))-dimethyltransferase RsmA [Opitutaceae bacterium]